MTSFSELLVGVKKKQKSALAQAISFIEREPSKTAQLFSSKISPVTRRIGITGPPGVGKSSLIAHYAKFLLKQKRKVGIVVIDPTSYISGGALLGDRIRMNDISGHKDVYIRSLASRGGMGGLSRAAYATVRLYELFGFDDILIETVGAGQSDVDITNLATTTVLLLVPQLGDEIQALKAGIMEMTHVIALNRAEDPLASEAIHMLQSSLHIEREAKGKGGWDVSIIELSKMFSSGLTELDSAISKHHLYEKKDFENYIKRRSFHEAELLALETCVKHISSMHKKFSGSEGVFEIQKKLLSSLKKVI